MSPFVLIGLVFAAFAALCAFLISYDEWTRHYASKREPFRYAIEAAIVAFVVFAILALLVDAFVRRFL